MTKFRFAMVVGLALIFTGCATSENRAFYQGKFSEVEKIINKDETDLSTLNNGKLLPICTSLLKLKKFNRVFSCVDKIESNLKKGDDAFNTGFADPAIAVHLLRAEAYFDLGDLSNAESSTKKALVWEAPERIGARSNSLKLAQDLVARIRAITMMALLMQANGKTDEVKSYYSQLEQVDIEQHRLSILKAFTPILQWTIPFSKSQLPPIFISYVNHVKSISLAQIKFAQEDYDGVLNILENDYKIDAVMRLIYPSHDVYGYIIANSEIVELPRQFMRSRALLEQNRIAEAKEQFDNLLAIPQISDSGEIYWAILFNTGRIAEKTGKVNEAIQFYRKAVDVIESQRASINTEANRISFIGSKQEVYQYLIRALFRENDLVSALEYVERSKARALVDMLANKEDTYLPPKNYEKIKELLARKELEDQQLITGHTASESQTRKLVSTTKAEIRAETPELAELIGVAGFSTKDIQAKITATEVLVEYYYVGQDLYVFVVTANEVHGMKLSAEKLEDNMTAFRKALENTKTDEYRPLAQALYEQLITPIKTWLTTEQLIIVPHGQLHYLPFSALHDGSTFFIEQYSYRLLPSAGVIKYLEKTNKEKIGGLLAFGNPDLRDRAYELPFAEKEAIAVASVFPNSKAFIGKEASKQALEQFGSGFRYLHIASHGVFDPQQPLKSALLLAKIGQNSELTVSDLYSMKLDADLVVLSACETGLGRLANGDDVIGLNRGFLYAGADSIVSSLWKVDDLATSTLMVSFYSKLKESNRQQALRQAQLLTKRAHPHPYFWAAFQLTGSARQ